MEQDLKEKKTIKKPHKKRGLTFDSYVILFAILVVAWVLTFVLPSGEFQRQERGGITLVVPNSYTRIEGKSLSLFDMFRAINEGAIKTSGIIFLILFVGGILAVVEATGALNAGVVTMVRKTQGKEFLLFFVVTGVFSLLGGLFIGSAVIAFVPLGLILARAMKLDAISGVAMVYLGTYSGFSTGLIQPAVLGYAQTIAEVPLYSGIGFRIVVLAAIYSVTLWYIVRYNKKIRRDPSKKLVPFADEQDESVGVPQHIIFTRRQKWVLFLFGVMFASYTAGVFLWKWGLNELSAIILMAIIPLALAGGLSAESTVKSFIAGARRLVYGALIIGLARAIILVLTEGQVLDTVVAGLAWLMSPFSSAGGALMMYLSNLLLNLLITPGGGQAAIVMPMMVPLADFMGLTRQVAVEAFKLGDGFTNIITPASGVLMANLAIGNIPWSKWVKFVFPLLLIWVAMGAVVLLIGVWTHWGPV